MEFAVNAMVSARKHCVSVCPYRIVSNAEVVSARWEMEV